MSDFQQIVDDIHAYLATRERGQVGDLAQLAENYASACQQTNVRLLRCARFLKNALRSEAVHLADLQPNLPETVDLLQFPESAEWMRVCSANGLRVAPALRTAALAELDRARQRERALEPLLAQHRLLAFAKAPALQRSAVLIALAERDPANPAWIEQLRHLEPHRLAELRPATERALASGDLREIERLLAELTLGHWAVAPPADLLEALRAMHLELQAAKALPALREILVELTAAHEAADIARGRAACRQWNEGASALPPALRKELAEEAGEALRWIAQQTPPERSPMQPPQSSGAAHAAGDAPAEAQKNQRPPGRWWKGFFA